MKKTTISKALKIWAIISTVQQVAMFGTKFLCAGKEKQEYAVGDYKVTVTPDPMGMGMNVVAQTDAIYGNSAFVTIDGLFQVMPESVKHCILAHEVGHMTLDGGMPDNMQKYAMLRMVGICPKEEKIADSFSTKLYGKKATKKMLKILSLVAPGPEVIQRLFAVK